MAVIARGLPATAPEMDILLTNIHVQDKTLNGRNREADTAYTCRLVKIAKPSAMKLILLDLMALL